MAPERVYLVTPEGERFRVLDTAFRDRRHRVVTLASAEAQYRLFRPEHGQRRAYRFRPGESRTLDVREVVRQFQASEFLASEPPTTAPDPR